MKSLRIGMLMCLMFFAGTSLARFVEVDGQVVMEAENYDSITPDADFPAITWKVYDQGTGTASAAGAASGGKYMHIENTVNPYTIEAGALTKAARVSYNIEIKTAGTYYLLVRGVWPSDPGNTIWFSVGTAAGQYGSCQVSRDNTSSPRVWVWWSQEQDAANPRSIVLAAGNYTFSIHQRERNVHMDKLILTRTVPTANPIAITPPFGPDETAVSARGLAHTPVPTNGDLKVVSTAVTSVSWRSPEEDKDGVFVDDPNIVSVGNYDVYFRTTEPNVLIDTPKSTNQVGKSWTITPALAYNTTYYWRVDTRVTWDSNSFTGAGLTAIMKGQEWTFKTKPFYQAPNVTFNNVRTALTFVPTANLAPSIADNTVAITEVTFTLLTDDYFYPAGAAATLTNTTTNLQTPTATLTTNMVGKYKVKLVVKDADGTIVEKIAEVDVYANGCLARKAVTTPTAWAANYYDRDGNCLVELSDFMVFVPEWLNDNGLKSQATYIQQGVLATADIVIEAENVYDPNSIDYVTEPPLVEGSGNPRIMTNDYASGGKNIGYTAAGHFLAYQINIPTAGAYTVYVMYAYNGTGRSMALGTVSVDGNPANDNTTFYGSVPLPGSTGNGNGANYLTQYKLGSAVINFATAGPQIVRFTWVGGAADIDFIALKKNP